LESLFDDITRIRVGTPYGLPPPISVRDVHGSPVAFLPRHGYEHQYPPHRVNYRANIYALHKIGVQRIVATNAVGAVNADFRPGDFVVPHDLVDFTEPYCPEIRKILIEAASKTTTDVWGKAVYACTEGPRFETAAEIRMFKRLGCDIVGMTEVPEAPLARELGMCYATLCFVSNMAAGIDGRISHREVTETTRLLRPKIHNTLMEALPYLPRTRLCRCGTPTEKSGDVPVC